MKKVNYILLLFSIFLIACEKEGGIDKIEGAIFKNCDNEPLANKTFQVRGVKQALVAKLDYYDLGELTTDATGYFKHVYETDVDLTEVQLLRNGQEYLRIYDEDKSGLSYYQRGRCYYKMVLKVNDPLSMLDTLYFSVTPDTFYVGPFVNNQTINIEIAGGAGAGRGLYIGGWKRSARISWGIGAKEYFEVLHDVNFQDNPNLIQNVPVVTCGNGGNVVIDLTGYSN